MNTRDLASRIKEVRHMSWVILAGPMLAALFASLIDSVHTIVIMGGAAWGVTAVVVGQTNRLLADVAERVLQNEKATGRDPVT